jgi:hypothetical protein
MEIHLGSPFQLGKWPMITQEYEIEQSSSAWPRTGGLEAESIRPASTAIAAMAIENRLTA